MQKNIGPLDRILRFIMALILFGVSYWQGSYIFLAVAIFTLYEAVASWCLLYQILGKNTCPIKKE